MLKEIEGFGGRYLAHKDGLIYCVLKNKYMTPRIEKNGYLSIALRNGINRKQYSVHRLIAKTFIDNPYNKKEVNHIDGNKLNNCVSNLEWCTRRENIMHSYMSGLKKGTNKGNFNTVYYNSKPVIYVKDCSLIEYNSIKDCARNNGVTKSTIQMAIKRGGKFKGGYLI